MNAYTRRGVASLVALSLVSMPVTAFAATHHTNRSTRKAAEKYCRALEKKDGKTRFTKKYGPKNAMGKCVSAYEKKHKA